MEDLAGMGRFGGMELTAGEVGYITASIKTVGDAKVGDTVTTVPNAALEPLPGYRKVNPMVFCGIYPADGARYGDLRDALEKLKLNIRALLESDSGHDKNLLDLCLDVIYHPNMKAFGLQQLVLLFINWKDKGNEGLGMTKRALQGTPFN